MLKPSLSGVFELDEILRLRKLFFIRKLFISRIVIHPQFSLNLASLSLLVCHAAALQLFVTLLPSHYYHVSVHILLFITSVSYNLFLPESYYNEGKNLVNLLKELKVEVRS